MRKMMAIHYVHTGAFGVVPPAPRYYINGRRVKESEFYDILPMDSKWEHLSTDCYEDATDAELKGYKKMYVVAWYRKIQEKKTDSI